MSTELTMQVMLWLLAIIICLLSIIGLRSYLWLRKLHHRMEDKESQGPTNSVEMLFRRRGHYIAYLQEKLNKHRIIFMDEIDYDEHEQEQRFNKLMEQVDKKQQY